MTWKQFWRAIIDLLTELLSKKTYDDPTVPVDVPTAPIITTPSEVPISKLELWAESIKTFEGWWPGSNSYRHNNPGNCKNLSGQFIHFDTYQDGYNYLCEYLIRAATGQHRAYPRGGETTINEFTHIYTGDEEPSPSNYALFIARNCGVTVNTRIKELL